MRFAIFILMVAALAVADTRDLKSRLDAGQAIHSKTFEGATANWTRGGDEIESIRRLVCVDPKVSDPAEFWQEAYIRFSANGFEEFGKIARCRDCEAFTTAFPIDEIPWDEASHSLREANPWKPYSVEWDRFLPRQGATGPRALSLGTDLMDDVYFDDIFKGHDNELSLRARKRWDSHRPADAPTMRRLLIAYKGSNGLDPATNLKIAVKSDERVDSPSQAQIDDFVSWVPTGHFLTKDVAKTSMSPVRSFYELLAAKTSLPNIESYEKVLALEPEAFLRSLRKRFHFQSIDGSLLSGTMASASQFVATSLTAVAGLEALSVRPLPPEAQELMAAGDLLKNFQAVIDQIKTKIPEFDINALSDRPEEAKKAREGFVALRKIFGEYGTRLTTLANEITGFDEENPYVQAIRGFLSVKDPRYQIKTTLDSHIKWWRELASESDKVLNLKEINTWAQTQSIRGYRQLSEDALGIKQFELALLANYLSTLGRQIEYAGTTALAKWFSLAQEKCFQNEWGPGLIDTMDVTAMFRFGDLEVNVGTNVESVAASKLNNTHVPTEKAIRDKMIFATLVNEVQIELGEENIFTDKIAQLKKEGKDSSFHEEIFGEVLKSLHFLSEMKGRRIIQNLNRSPVFTPICGRWDWVRAESAKGEAAMALLKKGRN